MTALMRAYVALLVLMFGSIGSHAGEIRMGALMQVKPNSIWFEDTGQLTHWQKLRKSGDKAAFESYQKQKLSEREAWQFIYPMTVKVLGHTPKTNQVSVEMLTEGRMLGTKWVLDAGTLMRKRAARP